MTRVNHQGNMADRENQSGSRQHGEKRSWMGFYTHQAVPVLAMYGDWKQEQR